MIPTPKNHDPLPSVRPRKFCPSCGAPRGQGQGCKVAAPPGRGFCGECGEPCTYVEDTSRGFTSAQWQHDSDHSPVYRCPAFRPKKEAGA